VTYMTTEIAASSHRKWRPQIFQSRTPVTWLHRQRSGTQNLEALNGKRRSVAQQQVIRHRSPPSQVQRRIWQPNHCIEQVNAYLCINLSGRINSVKSTEHGKGNFLFNGWNSADYQGPSKCTYEQKSIPLYLAGLIASSFSNDGYSRHFKLKGGHFPPSHKACQVQNRFSLASGASTFFGGATRETRICEQCSLHEVEDEKQCSLKCSRYENSWARYGTCSPVSHWKPSSRRTRY